MTPATEYALRTPTTVGARGEVGLPLFSFFGFSLSLSLRGDVADAPMRTLPFSLSLFLSLSFSLSFVFSLSLSLSSTGSLRFSAGETEDGSVEGGEDRRGELQGESVHGRAVHQMKIKYILDPNTVRGEDRERETEREIDRERE